MTNYAKGRTAEWQAIEDLAGEGFIHAMRSAGSHSVFDVTAWNSTRTRFVQVKRVSKKQSFKKLQEELAEVPLPPSSSSELWIWLKGKGWYKRIIVNQRS